MPGRSDRELLAGRPVVPTGLRLVRWGRVLALRGTPGDYRALDRVDFSLGLLSTWIVGMGRYWDDSRADWYQKLGTGSVVYVFVLAVILWVLAKPVSPASVRVGRVLAFVSMTSAPAILYAVPVEMWVSLAVANRINLWFLATVALWRLLLLRHFFRHGCGMGQGVAALCTLTPVAAIAAILVNLNLHHVVFDLMGGLREADKSSQDAAYGLLFVIALCAFPISVVCGISWLAVVQKNLWNAWKIRRSR